jgi:short-subunit dehydrogenase
VQAISADALAPSPGFGAHAAAQAASLSLALSLRAELRPIRVMTAFLGPLDDAWHQAVPPPKVAPRAFADAVAAGLEQGLEEIAVGDVARHRLERWRADPSLTIRETTHTR